MKIPEITLFRFNEWKGNNLALLFLYTYVSILLTEAPFYDSINKMVFLFVLFLCLFSFAYYLNDLFDIEKDRLAGKVNRALRHSFLQRIVTISVLSIAPFVLWFFYSKEVWLLILISLVLLLSYTYSSTFFRFKEKPFLSIINDPVVAQIIPLNIILFTINQELYTTNLQFVLLCCAWIFLIGIKYITSHHIMDYENDLRSSTKTFATLFGKKRTIILNRVIFPCFEIIFFISFLFYINEWLIVVYLGYLLYIFYMKRNNFSFYLEFDSYDPMKDLGYRVLNLFYIRYLPIIILLLLSYKSPYYLIVLCFHLIFFFENTKGLLNDIDGIIPFYKITGLIKKSQSLVVNYTLYYFFLLFGINLKDADENLTLNEKLLQLKNDKIRKPYNYETPNWVNDFTKNLDEIIQEWLDYTKNHQGINIDELSPDQLELNKDKKWKSLILLCYSYYNNPLEKKIPALFRLIKKNQKNLTLVMFSTTEAGKIIPPHHGNNHGVLRLQIGIDIQEPEQCYLRVEDKKIVLKNKELFIFDDTFEHELVNDSEYHRTVLIIDFYKPLPYFYDKLNRIQIKKMRNSDYVQNVVRKFS